MKRKINNSFADEYRTPMQLANKRMKMLKIKQKSANTHWIIFSAIILVANIIMLVLSSIALKEVIDLYEARTKPVNFWTQVMPTAGVSIASLSIFFLTLIISVYRGVMKSHVYLEATERIQYVTIQYESKDIKLNEKEFKAEINKIYKTALKSKTKTSFKKTLISVLTGGNDE